MCELIADWDRLRREAPPIRARSRTAHNRSGPARACREGFVRSRDRREYISGWSHDSFCGRHLVAGVVSDERRLYDSTARAVTALDIGELGRWDLVRDRRPPMQGPRILTPS